MGATRYGGEEIATEERGGSEATSQAGEASALSSPGGTAGADTTQVGVRTAPSQAARGEPSRRPRAHAQKVEQQFKVAAHA